MTSMEWYTSLSPTAYTIYSIIFLFINYVLIEYIFWDREKPFTHFIKNDIKSNYEKHIFVSFFLIVTMIIAHFTIGFESLISWIKPGFDTLKYLLLIYILFLGYSFIAFTLPAIKEHRNRTITKTLSETDEIS